ncbi:alpha beta-hydrolase [Raphidocelis subcapitata]|uniref:Alpha beta-hydrolase n=1 Tax=Raphidocelis subcapitata TaxID=307507 RepID=A0A2V0PPW4_9CHLO|nr:alpha beta-hydrolase [Raphidocelis subcapitata]|eukprot:GBG00224.1 alpha beta-hydrolase [Raphidocelis subcapitata]
MGRPKPPAPAAPVVNELSFPNARGQRLYAIEVLPPAGSAACVVVWAHGHGEHSRRKLAVFEAWAARGIAVFSLDHHGMGASEPHEPAQRLLVQSMGHLVDDFADYAAFAAKRHPELEGRPWFAGGYSIGGLTAALAVLRWQEEWAGLALYAPAIGAVMTVLTRIQKFLGPCLDAAVPNLAICQPVVAEALNPDPAAVAAYLADPLCYSGRTRIRTAFQYNKGMEVAEIEAPRLRVPLYCEHAKGDALARWEDSREFCASVASEDVTWTASEGGCHDGLSSSDAPAIAARMGDWMLAKAAAAKGGKAADAAAQTTKK